MTLLSAYVLPVDILIPCLNAAVASLIACAIALLLNWQTAWSLPARHSILVVPLATSLIAPLIVSFVRVPSLWSIRVSPMVDDLSPANIDQPRDALATEMDISQSVPVTVPVAVRPPVRSKRAEPGDAADSETTAPLFETPVRETTQPRLTVSTTPWLRIVGTFFCAVWFIGSVIGLGKMMVGLARLRRWGQSVTLAENATLAAVARLAAASVGLKHPVRIHQSNLLPAPVTFGLLRPRLVLPTGLDTALEPDQLRAVIQHEMAHIVRRDLWIGVVQQAATIVYWWNPLVLIAKRHLADLREQICDDIAIRGLPEPGLYATTLIDLAERCSRGIPIPSTIGIGSSPTDQLESRLRRIMSSDVVRCIRLSYVAKWGVCATAMLMSAAVVLTQVQVQSFANDPPKEPAKPVALDPISPAPDIPAVPSAPAAPQNAAKEAESIDDRDPFERHDYGDVEVRGRVVGPDGNPVAGATVYLRKYGIRVPSRKATTDDDGRYTFTTYRRLGPKLTVANPNPVVKQMTLLGGITVTVTEKQNYQGAPHTDADEIRHIQPWIIATAPGFGFGTPTKIDDDTIRLVPDEPIVGWVTDEKGNPLAGARLRVRDVFWPKRDGDPIASLEDRRGQDPDPPIPVGEGLDPWLGAMRRVEDLNEYYLARRFLVSLLENRSLGNRPAVYKPLIPPIVTDRDGRFRLTGIGRERVAQIYIEGVPDKASILILVANRSIEQPILIRNEASAADQSVSAANAGLAIFGNKFDLSLAPGVTIEGIVSDRATGMPVPGMRVIGPAVSRMEYPGFDRFFATTDDNGHYRFEGFPVLPAARFKVGPDKYRGERKTVKQTTEVPYFSSETHVDFKPGVHTHKIDFTLSHGIWITGKVIDDATGEGLNGETIQYHAFRDNPFLKQDLQAGIAPDFEQNLSTNQDGTFRVRGYPGRGIVTAGTSHTYLNGVGTDKIVGLQPDDLLDTLYDSGGFSPHDCNTTIEVNIADDAQTHSCVLRLKRGESRLVQVVDDEGDPIANLEASGLDHQNESPFAPVSFAFFQVTNLFRGESRKVVARHVERKLMGMAVVTEKDKGPQTLKLQPWGNLVGRLVDDQGKPRAGNLQIQLVDGGLPAHTINGLGDDKHEFEIEKDGKFHIDGLVPGVTYRLQVIQEGYSIVGDVTDDFTLKPGEARDLGNVKVKSADKR